MHIFLCRSSTGLNSLSKLSHHVDAEVAGMALAVKETTKCFHPASLKKNHKLVSPFVARRQFNLTLGPLWWSRGVFGIEHLYYAPGKLCAKNVDLLTRYRLHLLLLISSKFYVPSFLKPEVQNQLTTKVLQMKKVDNLPHLCQKQMSWTKMKGLSLQ